MIAFAPFGTLEYKRRDAEWFGHATLSGVKVEISIKSPNPVLPVDQKLVALRKFIDGADATKNQLFSFMDRSWLDPKLLRVLRNYAQCIFFLR